MIPFEWTSVDSSKINKVKFIPNLHDMRGDLLVEFNEGKVYRYSDVPENKVESLIHSSSPGRSFEDNIKPYHAGSPEYE